MTTLGTLAQHIVRRPQRMTLLAQIAEQGSITRAAKAAGLSYKAAWDAIDQLNNLADRPLVERSVGGRGGGGARLSAEGERLLVLYRRLESLQAQVLQGDDDDLRLLGRLMLHTSARNQLGARVEAIAPQGHHDLLDLALPGGARIRAQITRDSTERLELSVGSPVVALIKAGWLSLHRADAPADPALNSLEGRIAGVLPTDHGPSEVRIDLPSGQTLCALAEPAHLKALGLNEGAPVCARFGAGQVLLGTPS